MNCNLIYTMKNCKIIAEVGSHDGSFGNAMNLIKLAKECDASAVNFKLIFQMLKR